MKLLFVNKQQSASRLSSKRLKLNTLSIFQVDDNYLEANADVSSTSLRSIYSMTIEIFPSDPLLEMVVRNPF